MFSRSLRVSVATAILLTALLTAGALPVAQQNDREQSDTLARRASDRLGSLRDEADRLAAEERTVLGDLRKLEVQRQIRATELERARDAAQAAGVALAGLDQQVAALKTKLPFGPG